MAAEPRSVTQRRQPCAARDFSEFNPAPAQRIRTTNVGTLCSRATTLHPHLGTTLWMDRRSPVDESSSSRGQPVFISGTGWCDRHPSTGAPRCPPSVPCLHPHPATPRDLRKRRPSTIRTGASTTAGSLFFMNYKKNNRVDPGTGGARIGYRPAEVTPASGRLYGGSPAKSSDATASGVVAATRSACPRHRQRERSPP